MKQSSAGSMTEPKESESELQKLCIDLCNLIVESRIPGVDERGYGDGIHCPPHMGDNTHKCDPNRSECQKHQRMVKHLLRAVDRGIFEIDVLMLPDCCKEPKLMEKIQSKEYRLLERWSMKCSYDESNSNIEVPQLLRAVRSFLHFSQISAWLSATKGKSIGNMYYWVKPNFEASGAKFEDEPEVHTFPVCQVTERILGSVQVKHVSRSQYIPVIPCSKHPPNFALRTLQEDANLCRTLPFNSQVIRQLNKTCDNFPLINLVPETASLSPSTVLKTLTDSKKSSRILKHSNNQSGSISASDLSLNQERNINVISEAAYICDALLTKRAIQENICFRQRLIMKVKRLKRSASMGFEIIPNTSETSEIEQCNIVYPVGSDKVTSDSDISSTNINTFLSSHSSLNVSSLNQMKFRLNKKGNNRKRKEIQSTNELSCNRLKRPCTVANSSSQAEGLVSTLSSTTVSSNFSSRLDAITHIDTLGNSSRNIANTISSIPNFPVSSNFNASNQNGKISPTPRELANSTTKGRKRKAVELEELLENHSQIRQTPTEDATKLNEATESLKNRKIICKSDSSNFDFLDAKNPVLKSSVVSNPVHATGNSYFLKTALYSKEIFPSPSPNSCQKDVFINRNGLSQATNQSLNGSPRPKKFPKGRRLLGNFEESILKGCLPVVNSVNGFRVEIGASGSFCPNHLTLPANVTFYDLGNSNQVATPYVAHVVLNESEYYLPKKGVLQLTLFNPSGTVVKMFVLNYDLSNMPPMCHTFIREKTYYLPVGSNKTNPSSQKWLRFIIHLRFASSKTGRIYLYEDIKIVVLNKSNDDAASEFNQEPRELHSFTSVPVNPTFSNF